MEWIQLQNTWPVARRTLEAAQEAFKWQANKMCAKQKEFKVGNWVYLSTKYIQSTQQSRNLGPKHMGSFSISKIINLVTVHLELPKNQKRIHPVFHCNLLKPEVTSPLCPPPPMPLIPIFIEGEQHFEVNEILDSI